MVLYLVRYGTRLGDLKNKQSTEREYGTELGSVTLKINNQQRESQVSWRENYLQKLNLGEILDFFGDPICPKCKDSTRD